MSAKRSGFFYYLAVYMQLGFVIIANILIALLIGSKLDKALSVGFFTPVFILIGVAAAGYSVYKMIKRGQE